MANITASVPHQLGRAEAKRRIQEELQTLRGKGASLVSEIVETWDGDTMAFSVHAMGQAITGHVNVGDQKVNLDINLPWLLRLIASPFIGQVENRLQKLLEHSPSEIP